MAAFALQRLPNNEGNLTQARRSLQQSIGMHGNSSSVCLDLSPRVHLT